MLEYENVVYNPSEFSFSGGPAAGADGAGGVGGAWRGRSAGAGPGPGPGAGRSASVGHISLAEEPPIKWINIIFLPFQFWWQIIVLFAVCLKCLYGPLRAVFPFLTCGEPNNKYMLVLKILYVYICDPIYLLDTFLYIVHRQVVDEALKREYFPKSGLLILVDVVSMVPLNSLLAHASCGPVYLWPNILAFTEMLIVGELFSLKTTHSYAALCGGYALALALLVSAGACLLLLLTAHPLCRRCARARNATHSFDWRSQMRQQAENTTNYNAILYFYGSTFVFSLISNSLADGTRGTTYTEIILQSLFITIGFLLMVFVVMSKLFAENVFRLRRIYSFHPRVKRIIEETKRRHPEPTAHVELEKIYKFIWEKQRGINTLTDAVYLPLYMRMDICNDLTWAFFYHSPTLRNTSVSYKRWICQHIRLETKLPGEKFFDEQESYTRIYYLKLGTVQLISENDDTASLLSVSEGTIFGDISFFIPPVERKISARCFTYCEVFSISRKHMIISINKFPRDRKYIMDAARARLQHARDLQQCKERMGGGARADDESLAWLKRRWWEISDAVRRYKLAPRKSRKKCEIPPEEYDYHCAKYIGQLVLRKDIKQKGSLFARVQFPWILAANSRFSRAWYRIVITTVYLTSFIYPLNLIKMHLKKSEWFLYYWFSVDLIYQADLIISLITAPDFREEWETNLTAVIYYRIKRYSFALDVLSTFWTEELLTLLFGEQYRAVIQFNRLFKSYKLFFCRYHRTWNIKKEPLKRVFVVMALAILFLAYIMSQFMWISIVTTDIKYKMTYRFFYGLPCSDQLRSKLKGYFVANETCLLGSSQFGIAEIFMTWVIRVFFVIFSAQTMLDHTVNMLLNIFFNVLFFYHNVKLMAALYLKYLERFKYQNFVTGLKRHYRSIGIHPDLMQRLTDYLNCHWKYYWGGDVMHARVLRDEPGGVRARHCGAAAERAVGTCSAFRGADPALVRDIARRADFLVLPQHSTLIIFGVRTDKIMWVINGVVKCEYHSETGEKLGTIFPKNRIMSVGALFLNRAPLRTYTAVSDVEVLYLKMEDCMAIIKRYPIEEAFFNKCIEEIGSQYDKLYVAYLKKHRDYKKRFQEKLHAELLAANAENEDKKIEEPRFSKLRKFAIKRPTRLLRYLSEFRNNPESKLVVWWMAFRAVVAFVDIFDEAVHALFYDDDALWLKYLPRACVLVALVDIAIKLTLPYYDHRGITVTSWRKCALRYATRALLVDALSLVLSNDLILSAIFPLDKTSKQVLKGSFKFLEVYLVIGFFNYLADKPTANSTFLMIVKWHLVCILLMAFVTTAMVMLCVDVEHYTLTHHCWAPSRFGFIPGQNLTEHDMRLLVMAGLAATQSAALNSESGMGAVTEVGVHGVNQPGYLLIISLLSGFLSLFWWVVSCYLVVLVMLRHRGPSLFAHRVAQLRAFLLEERVEPQLVRDTMDHFSYTWRRTAGVDMSILRKERMGAIFREDLNSYFYIRTLQAADTLLRGGGALERHLASVTTERYFLPGADVTREMHLCARVYIVHRGTVLLSRDQQPLTRLTKGSMFGQLEGTTPRPLRVTATTEQHVDLLEITIDDFQRAINDDVRLTIADNPQSKNDFMAIKKYVAGNPYKSIQFILRKSKTIKIPALMRVPARADESAWLARWLLAAWVGVPALAAALTLHQLVSWPPWPLRIHGALLALDALHLIHVCADFFTVRVAVDDAQNECVYEYKPGKILRSWRFYFDLVSLLLPMLNLIFHIRLLPCARLLRLHSVFLYYRQFCKDFKKNSTWTAIKVMMLLLLLHGVTCTFLIVACEPWKIKDGKYPVPIYENRPKEADDLVDLTMWQWVGRGEKQYGCWICSPSYEIAGGGGGQRVSGYLVARARHTDYFLALAYTIALFTRTNLSLIVLVTATELLYVVIVNHIIYLVRIWFVSAVIIITYTKFRQMYNFDYNVDSLLKYMEQNRISSSLQQVVRRYTSLLWRRSKGNEIPSLAYEAPACLRQDLFSSLYMHHLRAPPLLRALPEYFLRQLGECMKKIVVFPGSPEAIDSKRGDSQLSAVLTTNMYFGLLPGLFPTRPYRFSYCTRTVVELVYLSYTNWSSLLDSYPEIKRGIFNNARTRRQNYARESSSASLESSKTV